jgi:hypothetical protein
MVYVVAYVRLFRPRARGLAPGRDPENPNNWSRSRSAKGIERKKIPNRASTGWLRGLAKAAGRPAGAATAKALIPD